MKNSEIQIQALIQKYFLQWLMAQRNVSPETIKSYRDTFRLYLRYIETHHGVAPSKMSVVQFDAGPHLRILVVFGKRAR
jgi:integrase/recombinase XerD